MKEVVIISGKGGTGKTSLAASFAVLAGDAVVMADGDVDAADLHLLLAPDRAHTEPFIAGEVAVIEAGLCDGCGRCHEVCRFAAVLRRDGSCAIDPLACEGCGYCARVCPRGAIANEPRQVGHWHRSRIRTGGVMVHAELAIGAENSGKLVGKVKQEARLAAERTGRDLVLVDGAPGVGCPVVSSLSGASLVVLVTEPTVSGLHDLARVHDLVARFAIPAVCILNKADLALARAAMTRAFLAERSIELLAELPYDEAFAAAITAGKTIVEWERGPAATIRDAWSRITAIVSAGRS